ncbi:hypothetical protein JCGZ_10404 [Jatropha curcas]|uniref:Uncharacterized protein n=1 Tax=Jatropha curcas TaxID=180498 RepID=A0A067LHQ4_JATCU|nr:hypothetical protein JCGZ_10404 [Jatropha curcas]
MPKSRALPEVGRATYTQKRQVASATFTCAGAGSTPESQKVCKRKSRARHPSARAREALLRGSDIWSRSRERDL